MNECCEKCGDFAFGLDTACKKENCPCHKPPTMPNNKVKYSDIDHTHCFSRENPPCGQKIEHFKCCLCEKLNPKIESTLEDYMWKAAEAFKESIWTQEKIKSERAAERESIIREVDKLGIIATESEDDFERGKIMGWNNALLTIAARLRAQE